MADTITIARDGYGQVEPNHLSAIRNGQVYGQLPAAANIEILENGMFVKYDYAAGECNFTGDGPWMMVFNEEKLYDERYQMHKHYAMKASDSCDGNLKTDGTGKGKIYPRVFAMHPGDIYTTNMVVEGDYALGDKLAVGSDGILTPSANGTFKVVKLTTMPDMQKAVKIQVIG